MSKQTNYVVKRSENYSDELQHWGKKEDHKYIDRKMVNGKWVYKYPGDVLGFKKKSFNNQIQGAAYRKRALDRQRTADAAAAKLANTREKLRKERQAELNESAVNAFKQLGETAGRAAGRLVDEAKEYKRDYDRAYKEGSSLKNAVKRVALDKHPDLYGGGKRNVHATKAGYEAGKKNVIKETKKDITKAVKNVADKADDVFDNARDAVSDKISDAKKSATKTIKTATEKAAKRRKKVAKAINNTVSSAKKHIDKGRDWLEDLFD